MKRVAGVDEAGRGPLAGPVVAGAVILSAPIEGLNDSKKLSEKKRLALYDTIKKEALAWSLGFASVREIDTINILQATLVAMRRAIQHLPITPDLVLVDGNQPPRCDVPLKTIIGGDALEPVISAASILAKVARDKIMAQFDRHYPDYALNQHKGYGTKAHLLALEKHGISPIHRRSFAPVSKRLALCE